MFPRDLPYSSVDPQIKQNKSPGGDCFQNHSQTLSTMVFCLSQLFTFSLTLWIGA